MIRTYLWQEVGEGQVGFVCFEVSRFWFCFFRRSFFEFWGLQFCVCNLFFCLVFRSVDTFFLVIGFLFCWGFGVFLVRFVYRGGRWLGLFFRVFQFLRFWAVFEVKCLVGREVYFVDFVSSGSAFGDVRFLQVDLGRARVVC